MTPRVLCTRPEQTIEEAMALMTDKRVAPPVPGRWADNRCGFDRRPGKGRHLRAAVPDPAAGELHHELTRFQIGVPGTRFVGDAEHWCARRLPACWPRTSRPGRQSAETVAAGDLTTDNRRGIAVSSLYQPSTTGWQIVQRLQAHLK